MMGAIFNLVTRVGPRDFWNTENDSLEISSLALNSCFSYKNVFQNGVNSLSKMVNHFFCHKAQYFI